MLVRTVECSRARRGRARLRAGLRLRPRAGHGPSPMTSPHRRRDRRRPDDPAAHRHGARDRGHRAHARHVLHEGETLFCALSWAEGLRLRADAHEAEAKLDGDHAFWRSSWLARAHPDHPLPPRGRTIGPGGQGPDVHAHRGDRRGGDHIAARDAGGERNWDYRYTGSATRRSPSRRSTSSTSTGRPTSSWSSSPIWRSQRGRRAADHVRDRRPA